MSDKLTWTTETRKISDLIELTNNPRKISDKRRRQLVKSLEKYNVVDIPVVDTDGTIISGNQRVSILCELGRGNQDIDVRVPNRKLTEDEIKEYCIIANSHVGEFDIKILSDQYKDVVENCIFDIIDIPEIKGVNDISDKIVHKYTVEADCNDETHQEIVFNMLSENGIKCRILTL